jgi:hypothetical protein
VAAVDLRHLGAALEGYMADTVLITHNPGAMTDQVMDPDTGKPDTPTSPDATVYAGKALVKPFVGQYAAEGANPLELYYYDAYLPLSAPAPALGDDVTITASLRDSALVGKKMTVVEVQFGTITIARRLVLQHRMEARARAGR